MSPAPTRCTSGPFRPRAVAGLERRRARAALVARRARAVLPGRRRPSDRGPGTVHSDVRGRRPHPAVRRIEVRGGRLCPILRRDAGRPLLRLRQPPATGRWIPRAPARVGGPLVQPPARSAQAVSSAGFAASAHLSWGGLPPTCWSIHASTISPTCRLFLS